jgi:hypothetical protein
LGFSPLDVIEIDNPNTEDVELKTQALIAPTLSKNILSLDLSQENTSYVRFVFTDRQKDYYMTGTIDKFFKSDRTNLFVDAADEMEEDNFKESDKEIK